MFTRRGFFGVLAGVAATLHVKLSAKADVTDHIAEQPLGPPEPVPSNILRTGFKFGVTREWLERMAKLEAECVDVTVGGGDFNIPQWTEAERAEWKRKIDSACAVSGCRKLALRGHRFCAAHWRPENTPHSFYDAPKGFYSGE